MKQKWAASARKGAFFGWIRQTLESEAEQLERRIIDGCREAILGRSQHRRDKIEFIARLIKLSRDKEKVIAR